jgi:hypothetical protein
MFYTKAFFKFKALRFTPPGRIDEDFYANTKERLVKNPNLKFESDFNFWQAYRGIFIVFVLFTLSVICSVVFFFTEAIPDYWVRGIPLFLVIIFFQPTIYFFILMIYYYRYWVSENRFHTDFRKAVIGSKDFNEFTDNFYTGKYAEPAKLKEYQFEGDIHLIKNFVKDRDLSLHMAIYKYSRPPFKFIILSTSGEVNEFIENQDGAGSLKMDNPIRRVIKYQTEIPCMFGNKRLKDLMELS